MSLIYGRCEHVVIITLGLECNWFQAVQFPSDLLEIYHQCRRLLVEVHISCAYNYFHCEYFMWNNVSWFSTWPVSIVYSAINNCKDHITIEEKHFILTSHKHSNMKGWFLKPQNNTLRRHVNEPKYIKMLRLAFEECTLLEPNEMSKDLRTKT